VHCCRPHLLHAHHRDSTCCGWGVLRLSTQQNARLASSLVRAPCSGHDSASGKIVGSACVAWRGGVAKSINGVRYSILRMLLGGGRILNKDARRHGVASGAAGAGVAAAKARQLAAARRGAASGGDTSCWQKKRDRRLPLRALRVFLNDGLRIPPGTSSCTPAPHVGYRRMNKWRMRSPRFLLHRLTLYFLHARVLVYLLHHPTAGAATRRLRAAWYGAARSQYVPKWYNHNKATGET